MTRTLTGSERDRFVAALRQEIGDSAVSTEPDDLATYGRDWTKVFDPAPMAIAFPRRTEDVVEIVRRCADDGIAIVPSGGRTGLAGGAVAARGELVVSTERMRDLGAVDTRALTLRAQAGAVTAAVHAHCEPHGVTWPVDFASKGSSQIGGNIATNAGGVKVIRYGLTRQWVLGLEVVTANGDVLELGGALEKNNTGFDLRQLFIGSEGTLGIITGATLKLTRVPGHLDVLLFAVPDLAGVLRLFDAARVGPFVISAFEFFTDRCFARLARHRALSMPLETPSSHYVLLEVEAHDRGALERWLESLFERDLILDGTLAQSAGQGRALWELREGISESLSATGMPHKNDIALPIATLDAFVSELDAVFTKEWPRFEICLFGHIGDGNLHVNVMKPDDMPKAEFLAHAHESDAAMFELVRKHHGSISAEHGVGLLKKDFLGYSRSPAELEMLRAIKRTLDPEGLLNPGKIL
ncbi:FAD-binding oxidoreductase [Sandaracinus amylolyticus]|uniref:D-2-hydroxyglutarate dehydrogenase n=1 Tax=Sandaracinus amylolyticus TaxID=927083 RepID=A0A0F6W461_9BACT|nr:FAD-binding oxidoreductase [Sandaracinus amylolyticus]AKF07037.1 D-2-hydroxyglutarate dehydrogenase [Sandaracinus amylolyticus]